MSCIIKIIWRLKTFNIWFINLKSVWVIWFTKHFIVSVSEKVPLPQSNWYPRSWQRCLQHEIFFFWKFVPTWLWRWTRHRCHPNRIVPRPVDPSSHRFDLCHTEPLKQLNQPALLNILLILCTRHITPYILLTCAHWRHLMFPNPVGSVRQPIGAGEGPGDVDLWAGGHIAVSYWRCARCTKHPVWVVRRVSAVVVIPLTCPQPPIALCPLQTRCSSWCHTCCSIVICPHGWWPLTSNIFWKKNKPTLTMHHLFVFYFSSVEPFLKKMMPQLSLPFPLTYFDIWAFRWSYFRFLLTQSFQWQCSQRWCWCCLAVIEMGDSECGQLVCTFQSWWFFPSLVHTHRWRPRKTLLGFCSWLPSATLSFPAHLVVFVHWDKFHRQAPHSKYYQRSGSCTETHSDCFCFRNDPLKHHWILHLMLVFLLVLLGWR